VNLVAHLLTLTVPLSYLVAWAWVSPRSHLLAAEGVKALVVGTPLALIASAIITCAVPEPVWQHLESYEGLLLVAPWKAFLGTLVLVASLAVLFARQGRSEGMRMNPMTHKAVVLLTLGVFVALNVAVALSDPSDGLHRCLHR
jgi:L-asparagine transporter-like permease